MENYRSLPRISNSDLTEFKNFIFGDTQAKPLKAFAFGTALHELVLEPATIVEVPDSVDLTLIQRLARIARNDKFLKWALRFSKKETVRLWQDPVTGLELKSKLDIIHKNRIVVDIKSTSCKSLAEFLKTCEQYDYDRQAAFYLDSIGARKFVFVAVQKVSPYHVWTIEHHSAGQFVETGRKKYKALLREWKRRADTGQPFTPSTWSHENVFA